MPRILIVNPNTSRAMTDGIAETATAIAASDTEVDVIRPNRGPKSLESFYEYHLAAVAVLEAIEDRADEYDGVVLACYGDPGLYPLKEALDVPVVGVAEASMATATLLGHQFSILVALERAVPMMENLARWYGLDDRLASVEPTGLSVLDLETDEERTLSELAEVGQRALDRGAEVLVLGCSGMSGYENQLTDRVDVPVIDPVADAVTTLEGLLAQGLTQSKAGLWSSPPAKEMRGELPGDGFG